MANRTVMVKNVELLKKIIVKNGLSYRKLANKISCSQTSISLILKGERNPSPKIAIDICKALDCEFDTIFFINNDYKSN